MDLPMGLLCRITINIGMRLPRGDAALRPTGGLLEAAMAFLSLNVSLRSNASVAVDICYTHCITTL
jgi:hypothetical protein